jgi:hypothetical protein
MRSKMAFSSSELTIPWSSVDFVLACVWNVHLGVVSNGQMTSPFNIYVIFSMLHHSASACGDSAVLNLLRCYATFGSVPQLP